MRIYNQVFQAIKAIKKEYIDNWEAFLDHFNYDEESVIEDMRWTMSMKLYDHERFLTVQEVCDLRAYIEGSESEWANVKSEAIYDFHQVMKNYRRGLIPEQSLNSIMTRIFWGWEVKYYA